MPSFVPSSPLRSIAPSSEAVANPPTDVTTSSKPACQHAPAVAAPGDSGGVQSNTVTCATRDIAPATSSSKETRHIVTVVSSDDAASETANATDDAALEVTQKFVISASANGINGIASAPVTSHDKPVESSNDIVTASTSEESNKVDVVAISSDSRDTAPVNTGEDLLAAKTSATETADPSRAMTVNPPTVEVCGNMGKHIQVASIAERFEEAEVNVEESSAKTKKRKSEDPPTKKGQRTKKKAKVPKDPNAPKKNLTAYMHYATYARDYIKSRNKQLKSTDVTLQVQRDWNEMNAAHRNYWNEKAAADKKRYEREWADYKDSDLRKAWQARVDEESRARKVTSESIMAGKPIKRVNEYEAYARSYIKIRNPRKDEEEVTKVVLRGWSALTAKDRNFWDGVTAAAQLESLVQFYQRVDLTVKDVVEAKVSTQEILDDLCVEEE